MMGFLHQKTVKLNDNKYILEKKIAEGGFSFVYLAHVQGRKKNTPPLAVKRILLQTPEQEEEVKREMAMHRNLHHPNIMTIIDAGIYEGKKGMYACLVFPFYENGSLQDRISRAEVAMEASPSKHHYPTTANHDPPFAEKECLRMFMSICGAVAAMHEYGLRHGDIKPANVLLSSEEPQQPILMDLGSASKLVNVIQDKAEAIQLQERSAVYCSAPYRAPELWNVVTDTSVDGRTDVWSLGCTLYAIAYGHSPFETPQEGLLTLAIVNGTFKFPFGDKTFSLRFKALVKSCLLAHPEERATLQKVMKVTEKMIEDESWKVPESDDPLASRQSQPVKTSVSSVTTPTKGAARQSAPSNLDTIAAAPAPTFANFADFDSAFQAPVPAPAQPTQMDDDDDWGDFTSYDNERGSDEDEGVADGGVHMNGGSPPPQEDKEKGASGTRTQLTNSATVEVCSPQVQEGGSSAGNNTTCISAKITAEISPRSPQPREENNGGDDTDNTSGINTTIHND